jgi:hypothetical protein
MKRSLAIAALATTCLLSSASPARAWDMLDFFAWMEEMSGPGPFGGLEISLELHCFELGTSHQVKGDQVLKFYNQTFKPTAVPLSPEPLAVLRTLAVPQIRRAIFSGALPIGDSETAVPKRSRANERRWANCWAAEDSFATAAGTRQSEADREISTILATEAAWQRETDAATKKLLFDQIARSTVTAHERGPKTGVVLGLAYYRSKENKLFDPTQTVDNEPRVEAYFVDALLHHKLTPAVDVGGGVGVTLLTAGERTSAQFHLVPLSVVIKPLAFVSTNRVASAFGARFGARLLTRDLEPSFFGVSPGVYSQRGGELLWNISAYIDVASLVWPRLKK